MITGCLPTSPNSLMSPFLLTSAAALAAFLAAPLLFAPGVGLLGLWMVIVVVYALIIGLGVGNPRLGFFLNIICRGNAEPKQVALTFDDGPDPATTPQLLELLARRQVAASFFCVGEKVEAHPNLAGEIVRAGHCLGNHTYHHYWWTNFLWGRRLFEEISLAQQAIFTTTGHLPKWFRPPVGLSNPHLGRALKIAGLVCVGWDTRSRDLYDPPETVLNRILKKVRNGSIILLHDGGMDPDKLLRIVDQLITRLRANGFLLVHLDDMLGCVLTLDAIASHSERTGSSALERAGNGNA